MYLGEICARLVCGRFSVHWLQQPDAPALASNKTDFTELLPLFDLEVAKLLVICGELIIYVELERGGMTNGEDSDSDIS